jgi:hypothetical protein
VSFLQVLATDAQLVTSLLPMFLGKLAANPTVQTIEAAIGKVADAIVSRETSFSISGYTVTAKLNSTPVGFSLSAAVLALENIVAGKTGTFTSGDIEIDIVKNGEPNITAPATQTPQ